MSRRGKVSAFTGERLEYLEAALPQYMSLNGKAEKQRYWKGFMPDYLELFPLSEYPVPPPQTTGANTELDDVDMSSLSAKERKAYRRKEKRLTRSDEERMLDIIKAWFWWRQGRSVQDERNPFGKWLDQLMQSPLPPRKRQLYQFVMSHSVHGPAIRKEANKEWETAGLDYKERLNHRCSIARLYLERLSEDTRKILAKERDVEHGKAMHEHNQTTGAAEVDVGKLDDEVIERCRSGLPRLIQPLLNAIQGFTGLSVFFMAGSQVDTEGKQFTTVAMHAVKEGAPTLDVYNVLYFKEFGQHFLRWLHEVDRSGRPRALGEGLITMDGSHDDIVPPPAGQTAFTGPPMTMKKPRQRRKRKSKKRSLDTEEISDSDGSNSPALSSSSNSSTKTTRDTSKASSSLAPSSSSSSDGESELDGDDDVALVERGITPPIPHHLGELTQESLDIPWESPEERRARILHLRGLTRDERIGLEKELEEEVRQLRQGHLVTRNSLDNEMETAATGILIDSQAKAPPRQTEIQTDIDSHVEHPPSRTETTISNSNENPHENTNTNKDTNETIDENTNEDTNKTTNERPAGGSTNDLLDIEYRKIEIPVLETYSTFEPAAIESTWIRNNVEYLLYLPDGCAARIPEWVTVVQKWVELAEMWEERNVARKDLKSDHRPAGFAEWFKRGRYRKSSRSRDTPPEATLSNLQETWWSWWSDANPDWRPCDEDGRILPGGNGTWEAMQYNEERGLVLFLVGLRWWFDVGTPGVIEGRWMQALKSIYITLVALVEDARTLDLGGEESTAEDTRPALAKPGKRGADVELTGGPREKRRRGRQEHA